MSFTGAHPLLLQALESRGFSTSTQVQRAVLDAPADRDLVVSARTGSGKTVAFGLVAGALMLAAREQFADKLPRCLVVAPTRELALQVARELQWLYQSAGFRIASCVGGLDIRGQEAALRAGVQVVVGTPGRLRDHLERGNLKLSAITAAVLDEADEMLDLGFREDLEVLLGGMPKERRTLMFSATMPPEALALAKAFLREPERLAVGDAGANEDIEFRVAVCAPREREGALVNVLRAQHAKAIVFAQTREGVHRIQASLTERGFASVALTGDHTQAERNRALQAIRDGRAEVCVATNVAARGLDLPALDLVVHADLPSDAQTLVHRSGRTGRAGRKGMCVIICTYSQKRAVTRLLRQAGCEAQWSEPPSAEQIREADREKILTWGAEVIEETTDEDRAVATALTEKLGADNIAAALARVLRRKLPEPEELPETLAPRAPRVDPVREGDAPRGKAEGPPGVWFKVNVGRDQTAHPHWLVPMICRRGRIEKSDIGRIDIRQRETRFEVHPDAVDQFSKHARRRDPREPEIRFFPV
jgi:ATP-dependent RNA helicase DeaD